MTESKLSMAQLTAVLDNVPAAVFVSAADSGRLLYTNALARELFPQINQAGAFCYTAAGFDSVCPFCCVGEMSHKELLVREYEHPVNHRLYQLSGKLIDWAGEEAHIEYILDITERKREEERLKKSEQETTQSFESIPCGLCIYQIEKNDIIPLLHNRAFYELMGYSDENIRRVEQKTEYLNVHPEDLGALKAKIDAMLQNGSSMRHTYRLWHDRAGEYRWIHLEAAIRTGEDGRRLLYGVYSDVSEQERLKKELTNANEKMKEAQRELDHLINSIPGGIVSYRVEDGRFIPEFFSDGTAELAGFTREEYESSLPNDALEFIYEQDRQRVTEAAMAAVESGEVLDIAYRTRNKNGNLVWIHLNGRRMGPLSRASQFYAVLTNMLSEVGTLTNEKADGVYVIDKNSYELLYINESKKLALYGEVCVGKTCFAAIHGLEAPCAFCTLKTFGPDEQEHEISVEGTGLVYAVRVKESVWNGIPAYIMYLRDVTGEVRDRREKERLELYFQTLIKNLPGGIAVLRCTRSGDLTPEYVSEGFAALLHMTIKETEDLYRGDVYAAIHPEDVEDCRAKIEALLQSGEEQCELSMRFRRRDGGYLWLHVHISLQESRDGVQRLYCIHTDIDQLVAEKEKMSRQYEEMILRHYRAPGPGTLLLGHCSITQNQMIKIKDFTDSRLTESVGLERETFYTGIAGLIVDEEDRESFLNTFLNESSLETFARGGTEKTQTCFIRLPGEPRGRYAEIRLNMVETPDKGDITGILSVTDVTDQVISGQILRQMTVNSHDYVVDLDLSTDSYSLLAWRENAKWLPAPKGRHSERVASMVKSAVVPKDRETYVSALAPEEIRRRLLEEGLYTFDYSAEDEDGGVRSKTVTVSAIDLRLDRVSLVCTDITDSIRDQQNLLSMLAYTFELAGMINVKNDSFVMYTRQMILENLPPFTSGSYQKTQERFAESYVEESQEDARRQFSLETMLRRLGETPAGYEFILPFQGEGEEGLRYKQINILWGDRRHETICMVRADVTEALAAERQAKRTLKKALITAEEANRAKSDFLSAMSHDIRTPMNAIMGMASLASAHMDDRAWMEDCLQKISIASKHLLSLVNDVLDMSRIERGQLTLNPVPLSVPELTEHLSKMMDAQAKKAGITLNVSMQRISHPAFYGDSLRINQILVNLLSNALKFTPAGGRVDFLTEELPPVRGDGWVRYCFTVSDTGIGMSEKFLNTVFEPFVRADSSAQIEGTGLGLSIVQGIVKLMKGRLSVESRPGEGTAFRVELEFEAAPDEAAPSAKPSGSSTNVNEGNPFSGRRFLVAEDNALNAEILCQLLRDFGAELDVSVDGAKALRAFEEAAPGAYDAILMDIQMPNMNGYEATRAIRDLKRPDAKTIPIIALTANAFAEDIQTALDVGMNAHIAKPIDVAVLKATLTSILQA